MSAAALHTGLPVHSPRANRHVLTALLVLALILRFAYIGEKSLWFDEAYSAALAAQPWDGIVSLLRRNDTHPPLYYLLLSGWVKVFGAGEPALRSLGAAASTLTVAGTWWLGRQWAGQEAGVLAAFITAVAPLQVLAAQEARMYPLLGLLVLLSWATLLTALDGRLWAWVGYVAAMTLALYTHYFAFLSLTGQALFVLVQAGKRRQQWLLALLAVVILYTPWLGTVMDTVLSGRGWPFFRPAVGLGTLTSLLGLFSFGGHAFGFDGYFGGGTTGLVAQLAPLTPFLAVVGAGLAAAGGRRRAFWGIIGYLVVPIALAFVFSLRLNIFYARYFSYVFPPFAVLVAMGMLVLARRIPRHRVALIGFLAVFLAFNVPVLMDTYASPGFQDWRGDARLLKEQARSQDLIVLIPAIGLVPFPYYFKGPQRVVAMTPREFGDIQRGIAVQDAAAEEHSRRLFRSYAAHHEVMWIVAVQPFPPAAVERLARLLAGVYELRAVAQLSGIRVWKTVRHPGVVAPR